MTVVLAWVSIIVFGYFAYGVSIAVFPKIITCALGDATAAKVFPAYFSLQIPPIMIALYMALDGMGTACNLTGDGAIALIVDRLKGNEKSAKCASCPTQMR